MKQKVLAVLLILGVSVYAQPPKGQLDQNRKEKRESLRNLTPQERADLKTKRMTLDLNLTEAQAAEIHKINLEVAESRETKKRSKKESKEWSYEDMSSRLETEIEVKRRIQSILTEEQFKKFERSQKRQKRHHRKHLGRKDR